MNDQTRKQVNDIKNELNELKNRIEIIEESEQEKFDNLTDSLQSGTKGDALQEAIDNLHDSIEAVDVVIDFLDAAST